MLLRFCAACTLFSMDSTISFCMRGSGDRTISLTCECAILGGEQRQALEEFSAGATW